MFYALSFVPEANVVALYDELIKTTFFRDNAEELQELLDYFETTQIGSVNRRFRIGPIFGLGLWNHYHKIVEGAHNLEF